MVVQSLNGQEILLTVVFLQNCSKLASLWSRTIIVSIHSCWSFCWFLASLSASRIRPKNTTHHLVSRSRDLQSHETINHCSSSSAKLLYFFPMDGHSWNILWLFWIAFWTSQKLLTKKEFGIILKNIWTPEELIIMKLKWLRIIRKWSINLYCKCYSVSW